MCKEFSDIIRQEEEEERQAVKKPLSEGSLCHADAAEVIQCRALFLESYLLETILPPPFLPL